MKKQQMEDSEVRVIKVGREALFEFIYEKIADDLGDYFDVDRLSVMSTWDMDWENGQFIFCVHKDEDADGHVVPLPPEIDLGRLMQTMPDTTSSLYSADRYRVCTKDELIALSKNEEEPL